jgi:hypothetical protein
MGNEWILAQLVVSAALAGLVWTVQLTVYPLFKTVWLAAGEAGFAAYHRRYTARMGYVAAPLMVAEAVLAGAWWVAEPQSRAAVAGVVLVAVLWVSTFAVQVPLHGRLARFWDEAAARRLTLGNWVRTAAWTMRVAGLVWVLATRG